MRILPRGKLITTFSGGVIVETENFDGGVSSYRQEIAFHLFEHKWFGRNYKVTGKPFLYNAKKHPMYSRVVFPWMNGKSFAEINRNFDK